MKLLCYGASVTAQKFESGYFQHLEKDLSLCRAFSEIRRVAFGASQYEYAGYAFMNDVLLEDANICLIDWLTPGMKSFSNFKIDLLNQSLLNQGCLPIWLFFPRVRNFSDLPEAYYQVEKSAANYRVPFLDLRTEMSDFEDDPRRYLRDDVHTTEEGAFLYSKKISSVLNDVLPSLKDRVETSKKTPQYVSFEKENVVPPTIKEIGVELNNDNNLEFHFSYPGGFFEVFFETDIGPHMCLTEFTLFLDGELFHNQVYNNADPWSHYKRHMVIETFRKRIPSGNYTLRVSKFAGNPFQDKKTKKPLTEDWIDNDRHLTIKRASLSVSDFTFATNKEG